MDEPTNNYEASLHLNNLLIHKFIGPFRVRPNHDAPTTYMIINDTIKQIGCSYFWHMDGPTNNYKISFHLNNPQIHNFIGPNHGTLTTHITINDTIKQIDCSYSTSTNMLNNLKKN